ncbi:MAG TPA: TRAP transporter large permease subunit [Burkholderiaceae bacterium]|nr:TRAP transporter large permease subunit [Burkholderiaceae bacterium]
MNIAFLFLVLLGTMLLGVPIAVALGLTSVLTLLVFGQESLASMALKFFQATQKYELLALPFFILAGTFLTTGGAARRLIDFANAAVGHFPGGLALAAVVACMLFASISGSSPATVIAVGSIAIAGMVRNGYSLKYATGVVINAGTLGILLPPSIVMVVYAAATEQSVGRLFAAGIVPGFILALMLMIAVYVSSRLLDTPRVAWGGWRNLGVKAVNAIWGLLLVVIVLGGIYVGAFTPTEAAAMSAVYAFIVAVFIYRDLKLKDVFPVLLQSGRVVVMLMFIISNAGLFAYVLTSQQIPQALTEAMARGNVQPWMFLLSINIAMLIAGNFMEPTSIVLIFAPIVFPIAMRLGINPIHLGVLMTVNMEIGLVHPPVGLNLFVAAGVTRQSLWDVTKAALPWLAILVVFLILITYVPILSTWLPDLAFGKDQFLSDQ